MSTAMIPPQTGAILGWTSTNSNEDTDMSSFTYPVPSVNANDWQQPSIIPTRPDLHNSLVIAPSKTAATGNRRTSSSPSDRRARQKREEDPDWVPRPLNSFMLFRVEYSRKHAQQHTAGDATSAVAEKTLSKRASEAWKGMDEEQKKVYKLRAEKVKAEHNRRHPNYRYKPRRRNTKQSRSPSALSRRERVVSFIQRRESGDFTGEFDHSPTDDYTGLRSSPEPSHVVRRRRSHSFPFARKASDQHEPVRTHFLEPETVTVGRRARSSFTRPPSIYESPSGEMFDIPSPYTDESVSYSWDSSSPSTPEAAMFNNLSLDDGFFSGSSGVSPQITGSSMVPDMPIQGGLGAFSESIAARGPGLALQTRQRSNTTSALPPSPLAVVSSSLANWNGTAAASTCSLPALSYTQHSPLQQIDYQPLPTENFAQPMQMLTQSPTIYAAGPGALSPIEGNDIDLTPRVTTFPKDVQDSYAMQNASVENTGAMPYPQYPMDVGYGMTDLELEAYWAGLQACQIVPPSLSDDLSSPIDDRT